MVPVTGVAAIGVDTGDITIITTIHIMDGVEATGEVVMDGHAEMTYLATVIIVTADVMAIAVVIVTVGDTVTAGGIAAAVMTSMVLLSDRLQDQEAERILLFVREQRQVVMIARDVSALLLLLEEGL